MLSDDYRKKLELETNENKEVPAVQPSQPQQGLPPNVIPVQMPPSLLNGKPGEEHFFGWQIAVVREENQELMDVDKDPFFQQFPQQICDHLAIAQLKGMNSANIDGHQFVIIVVELPNENGQAPMLPPDQCLMFTRAITHQLIDGGISGTIRVVGEEPPAPANEGPDGKRYNLAGWGPQNG